MKNWVVSEDKEFVSQVGEFLIQCTTIENQLQQIFEEFENDNAKRNDFSHKMLGGKIFVLAKVLKSEDIEKRLNSVKEIRNRVAHDVVSYDPVKKRAILSKLPNLNLEDENKKASELISDLQILTLSLANKNLLETIGRQ